MRFLTRLQTGFEMAYDGLIYASFYLVEPFLTEMLQRDALDDMYKRSVIVVNKSSTFVDAITTRALASPRLDYQISYFFML